MKDHAEEEDGCGADGLLGEEVVGLGSDARADRRRLRGEDAGALGGCLGEVLDDEVEVRERGRESDCGAACGAADLSKDRGSPPPLALATKFFSKLWKNRVRWLLMGL